MEEGPSDHFKTLKGILKVFAALPCLMQREVPQRGLGVEAGYPWPRHMALLYSLVAGPLPEMFPPVPPGMLSLLCPLAFSPHHPLRAHHWKQASVCLLTFPKSSFLESRGRDLGSWPQAWA